MSARCNQDFSSAVEAERLSVTDSDREQPTVLIVDDRPETIDALRLMLERDYRIQSALGGEQALQVARANRVDLILLGARILR